MQENTNQIELAYTGVINNRATVSVAVYYTKNTDEIFFTQTDGIARPTRRPAGPRRWRRCRRRWRSACSKCSRRPVRR